MNRRGFIFGLGASVAVIRTPGLLMPIKPIAPIWIVRPATTTAYVEMDRLARYIAARERFVLSMVHPPMIMGADGKIRALLPWDRGADAKMLGQIDQAIAELRA